MSFQRTLMRFSVRAMTPSASSWHGLRVQSRAYTLEFSPSSTGPRRESLGRWSMNAAVAASPSHETETEQSPISTKRPMPARAWRACRRFRSLRRLRASPGSGSLSGRGARRRLSGMLGPRQRG